MAQGYENKELEDFIEGQWIKLILLGLQEEKL